MSSNAATVDGTTVHGPNDKYEVDVSDVWLAIGIDNQDAWTLPDDTLLQRVLEAVIEVEAISGPNVAPQNKKTVVVALAAQFTLSQEGEQMVESMDALDVSVEYDVNAQQAQIESRVDRLLDALREKGKFVFRSY